MVSPEAWVKVYYYATSQYGEPDNKREILALLDPTETERFQRYHFDHSKWAFATARWMVKTQLAQLVDAKPVDILLSYNDNGKPLLASHPNLHFSISHTDTAVAVAISNRAVGIDIEQHERRGEPWQQAETFLNTHIAQQIEPLDAAQKKVCFTRYWTAMEALVKYRGTALFQEKDHFATDLALIAHDGRFRSQGLCFNTFDTALGEQLTICTQNHPCRKAVFVFDGWVFSQEHRLDFIDQEAIAATAKA